jgi:hypothetical protein
VDFRAFLVAACFDFDLALLFVLLFDKALGVAFFSPDFFAVDLGAFFLAVVALALTFRLLVALRVVFFPVTGTPQQKI